MFPTKAPFHDFDDALQLLHVHVTHLFDVISVTYNWMFNVHIKGKNALGEPCFFWTNRQQLCLCASFKISRESGWRIQLLQPRTHCFFTLDKWKPEPDGGFRDDKSSGSQKDFLYNKDH